MFARSSEALEIVVATTTVLEPASSSSSRSSSPRRPRREPSGLVEQEHLGVVEQRPADREPLVIPREYVDTRSLRASQIPKRSRSMPARSRHWGTR